MEWIISANQNVYNHKVAFEKWGFIDWKQKAKYSVGDIVYIYCTRPYKKIMYATKVEKVNMDFSEIQDDKEFWYDLNKYEVGKKDKYIRLSLMVQVDNELLSLDNLMQHGLRGAPQGPVKVKEELHNYIKMLINDYYSDNIFPNEINEDIAKLHEGIGKSIFVNKYERSLTARNKCIEYNGCICRVCGMDFYKVYGELGRGFIHVHHIIPLSQIKDDYVVDYKKDLMPVCPNCHAMLHKKLKGKYLSVDELKKIVSK